MKANIVWCENVGAAYMFSPHIAEFFNTLSNVVYFIAAFAGPRRIHRNRHLQTPEFVFSELMLLVVGVRQAMHCQLLLSMLCTISLAL